MHDFILLRLIQIIFGCFFSARFGWSSHRDYKKNFAKSGIWMILYLCLFSLSTRLFYDTNLQLIFLIVSNETLLFASNCIQTFRKREKGKGWEQEKQQKLVERVVFSILAIIAVAVAIVIWIGRNMADTPVTFFNTLVAVILLLINVGVWKLVSVFEKSKKAQEELTIQNQLATVQIESQQEIRAMYEQMCALKHDMKSHLYTVSGLLELGEYEKAKEYIGQMERSAKEGDFVQTKNPVIDALLMSKRAIASKEMIQVEMTANLTAELLIRDYDLTIMLGNLYDNAVDACRRIEKDSRWIRIQLVSTLSDFMIVFKNPVAKNQSENRDWKSTKSDGNLHGYGIKNIDKTVALYDGYCSRTIENGVFSCQIRMQNRKLS